MIIQMIAGFLGSQVGQTLTKEAADGLVLLVKAAVEHHTNTALAALPAPSNAGPVGRPAP